MSLADLLMKSALNSTFAIQRKILRNLPSAMIGIKHFTYDRSFQDVIALTENIQTADMIEHLRETALPFHQFWIEGPFLKENKNKTALNAEPSKSGFLVSSMPDEQGFCFESYYSVHMPSEKRAEFKKAGVTLTIESFNDMALIPGPCAGVIVTPDHQIELNDDYLEKIMDEEADYREKVAGTKIAPPSQADEKITMAYNEANFILRALVVLSAGIAAPNVSFVRTPEEIAFEKSNKSRLNNGKRPLLALTPIEVDVARMQALSKKPKDYIARILTGVTKVREHMRESVKGFLHLVHSHKRRIQAPVDRTNAPYKLTASQKITLEIDEGRVRKIPQAVSKPPIG